MSCSTPTIFSYFASEPGLLKNQDFGRPLLYDFAVGIPVSQPVIDNIGETSVQITNPYLTTLRRRKKTSKRKSSKMDLRGTSNRRRENPFETKSVNYMEYPEGTIKRVIKCSDLKQGKVPGFHFVHKCRSKIKTKFNNRGEVYHERRMMYPTVHKCRSNIKTKFDNGDEEYHQRRIIYPTLHKYRSNIITKFDNTDGVYHQRRMVYPTVLKCRSNIKTKFDDSDEQYHQRRMMYPTVDKCRPNIKTKFDNSDEVYHQRRKLYCYPYKERKMNKKYIFPGTCGLAKDLLPKHSQYDIYKQPSSRLDSISENECCKCS